MLDLHVIGQLGAEHRQPLDAPGAARPEGGFILCTGEALAAHARFGRGEAS